MPRVRVDPLRAHSGKRMRAITSALEAGLQLVIRRGKGKHGTLHRGGPMFATGAGRIQSFSRVAMMRLLDRGAVMLVDLPGYDNWWRLVLVDTRSPEGGPRC